MNTLHTLEQIARETAAEIFPFPNYSMDAVIRSHAADQIERATKIIHKTLRALQTAAEQPEGADWGEAEKLATLFHDTYERLAPSFGYETRPDTKQFDAASKNGRLMVATCAEIIRRHAPRPDEHATKILTDHIADLKRMAVVLTKVEMNRTAAECEKAARELSALRPLLAGQVAGGESDLLECAEALNDFLCEQVGPIKDIPDEIYVPFAGAIKRTRAAMRPEQPEGAKRPADRPQDAQQGHF